MDFQHLLELVSYSKVLVFVLKKKKKEKEGEEEEKREGTKGNTERKKGEW